MQKPVTAVFDIGKTNKKFFLFDQNLKEIYHEYQKLALIEDEDGYPCDDLEKLTGWIKDTIARIIASPDYNLININFSTYGATLVHLDEQGKPVAPLYNYLKPFPQKTLDRFISTYGKDSNDLETASPCLGMLNSGLQLYWLKYDKPEVFRKVKHTLHFPQYLSYLFSGKLVSEPTSIGCHTKLWDFSNGEYHQWLDRESLLQFFPEIVPTTYYFSTPVHDHKINVGVGIHDSSSALASYLLRTKEPFVLVSTGTWSITLNPFTKDPLTSDELHRDCLNYLDIQGNAVKASRLFLGNELDHQLQDLNHTFHKDARYYKQVKLDPEFLEGIRTNTIKSIFYPSRIENPALVNDVFPEAHAWNASLCSNFEEAYHQVIWGLVQLQVASVKLAIGTSGIRRIFVDGGFIDNDLYIKLLQEYLPGYSIEVSHMPLGSAYGAAVVMQRDQTDISPLQVKSAYTPIL